MNVFRWVAVAAWYVFLAAVGLFAVAVYLQLAAFGAGGG